MRVHVSPLALGTTVDDLKGLFKPFGEVAASSVHVKDAGEWAFGFVEIAMAPKEWLQVRSRLNGTHWRGLKITLAEASPDYRMKLVAEQREVDTPAAKKRRTQEKDVLHGKYIDSMSSKKIKVNGPNGKIVSGPEAKHKRELKQSVEKTPTKELVSTFQKGIWKSHAGAVIEDVSSLLSVSSSATESEDTSISSGDDQIKDSTRPAEPNSYGNGNQAATALKGIFHPSTINNDSFTLFSPPTSPVPTARHETSPARENIEVSLPSRPQPLFFPHFAVPSLSVQSQFAREFNSQGLDLDAGEWEETWSGNISEWMKSMKRRRRDAVRSSRH